MVTLDTRNLVRPAKMPDTPEALVIQARDSDEDFRWNAIAGLFETYANPCYFHIRDRGKPHEEAKDALMSFVVYLWEEKTIRNYMPDRGRFSDFLLGALNRFLADVWRAEHVRYRAPEGKKLSLSMPTVEHQAEREASRHTRTEEENFEQDYFRELKREALASAWEGVLKRGDAKRETVIKMYLEAENPLRPDYAAICRATRLTQGQVRHMLEDFRNSARESLRFRLIYGAYFPPVWHPDLLKLIECTPELRGPEDDGSMEVEQG